MGKKCDEGKRKEMRKMRKMRKIRKMRKKRKKGVTIRYKDALGVEHTETFSDYPSIIVQHEMDHLTGEVILNKVSRLKRSRYLKKVKKWAKQAQAQAQLV